MSTRPSPPAPDTAIVTGGAGTLGSAICAELARTGFKRIAIVDLDAEKSKHVAIEIERSVEGVETICLPLDITNPDTPSRIMAQLLSPGRRISCLVNNAATNRRGSAKELLRSDWDIVMAVNLTAPMFLSQAAIPHWRETGAGGSIVNISSRAWLAGTGTAYSATKAGLVGLTHALSVELGPLGVRVNAVGPSYIESPFNRQARTPEELARIAEVQKHTSSLGRLCQPEDVANAVAYLASDRSSFITGEVLYVAGGGQLAPNASATRAYGL